MKIAELYTELTVKDSGFNRVMRNTEKQINNLGLSFDQVAAKLRLAREPPTHGLPAIRNSPEIRISRSVSTVELSGHSLSRIFSVSTRFGQDQQLQLSY